MTCREEQADRRFAGMTFVLTGALEKFTREEAGEMIERRGGKAAVLGVQKDHLCGDGSQCRVQAA